MSKCTIYEDLQLSEEYAAHRPKYPVEIFNAVMEYVRESNTPCTSGRFPLAVDVGCGPGITSTYLLAPHFDKVLGVDPSKAQIEQANIRKEHENLEFRVAKAECLPVEDKSVTLIQAAAVLHWVDPEKFYQECDRVLVPGGVITAFCYQPITLSIVNHPNASALNLITAEINYKNQCKDTPGFCETDGMVWRRYTDDHIQIPYEDRKRIDSMYFDVPTTIGGFEKFIKTNTFFRVWFSTNEEARIWWNSCLKRLMAAYGTEDLDAPLTYRVEVFMLLGRKPIAQEG